MEKLREKKPVLGICFGHQLMADAFGMEVIKNPLEQKFYGAREITFQSAFGKFNKGQKAYIFKAHSYQVSGELKELEVLASSDECAYEALFHPNLPYWGFQGHPEASEDFYHHEILEHDVTLKEEKLQRALKEGLSIIKTFCLEL